MKLDVATLSFILGVVVPLLVGLLTKLDAPPWLKAIANLLLSAVAGVLTTALEAGGAVISKDLIVAVGIAWLTSIVSYYGLWKPTAVAPVVQAKTASFGIGRRAA